MKRGSPSAPLPAVADIKAWLATADGRPKASAAARAFGVRGIEDRRAFKLLYRQALGGATTAADRPEGMPPVTLFKVTRIDSDGAIRAAPERWDGAGDAPEAIVQAGGGASRLAPGVRLIARVEARDDDWIARPIRILPGVRADEAELAVVEADGRGRLSLKAARPGRERYWSIADAPPSDLADGDLVLAQPLPTKAGPRGRDFRARIVSVHGRADDPATYGLALLQSMEAPVAFPEDVLAAAAAAEPPKLDGREDLRGLALLTIDGADARDFDDAVYAERVDGGWRVVVAIADVSSYVRPNSALDAEARLRGNSTYLPDRAIPMLPEALSNGLCSLKPEEDRACLFVDMRFGDSGARRSARFARGLMRSNFRLTYEIAAEIGADDASAAAAAKPVRALYGAFRALTEGRQRRGPLELELPERIVHFDDRGRAVAMGQRPSLSSHRLIEEFMVQANAAAAEALLAAGATGLYRVHDKPDPERVGLLAETAAKLGASHPGARLDRPRDLTELLDRIEDSGARTVLSELILRAQARAAYAAECRPHFGLALRHYAHFTSPIRRYADLVVHRALIETLALGSDGDVEAVETLETVADQINRTERRSALVERAVMDRYSALLATGHVGETLPGRIVGANRAGLFIRLDGLMLDGFAPAALLPADYWSLSRDGLALEASSGGKAYRVGDDVTVRVRDADAATGGVTMELQGTSFRHKSGKGFTRRRRK